MADVAIALNFAPAKHIRDVDLVGAFLHKARLLRRRARRNRYLALTGHLPRRYPWFEAMFTGMSGR